MNRPPKTPISSSKSIVRALMQIKRDLDLVPLFFNLQMRALQQRAITKKSRFKKSLKQCSRNDEGNSQRVIPPSEGDQK